MNKYLRAFPLMALERIKHCESVSALAEELGIHRTVLYPWTNHLNAIEGGAADAPIRELRKQVLDLKRVLANGQIQQVRPLRRKLYTEVGDEFLRNSDLPNRVR